MTQHRYDSGFLQPEEQMHPTQSSSQVPPLSPTPPINTLEEEPVKPGFFDYVKDIGLGAISGVPQAVNETLDFGGATLNFAQGQGFKETAEEDKWFRLPEYNPETAVGSAAKEISAFVVGFFTAGKFLKAAKVFQGAGKLSAASRGMAQGAVSDFLTRDGQEERLSNLLEQFPSLSNPVTRFLAADEDDSQALGRFKNALEGLGLGVITEGLIKGLSILKRLRKASSPEEEARVLLEFADENLDASPVPKAPETPRPETAKPSELEVDVDLDAKLADEGLDLEVAPKSAEVIEPEISATIKNSAEETSPTKPAPEAREIPKPDEVTGPRPPDMDDATWSDYAEAMRTITEIATSPDGTIPIGTNISALRKAFENDKIGSKILESLSRSIRDSASRLHTRSQEWWSSNAEDILNTLGLENSALFFDGASRNPDLLDAIGAWNHAAKLTQSFIVEDAVTLAEKLTAGTATPLDMLRFYKNGAKARSLQKAIEDTGTAAGRLLKSHDSSLDLTNNIRETLEAMLYKGLPVSNTEAKATLEALGATEGKLLAEAADIIELASKGATRDVPAITKTLQLLAEERKESLGRYLLDSLNEYRINSLLSSPITLIVNAVGPAIKSGLVTPVEQMVGGILSGQFKEVRKGFHTMVGMGKFIGDSMQAASKLLKKGQYSPILDASTKSRTESYSVTMTTERMRKVLLNGKQPGEKLNVIEDLMCQSWGFIGSVTRLPSRGMTFTDEFLKQLNYRANLYANFTDEAVSKGMRGQQIEDYITQGLKRSFDKEGHALKGNALEYARRNTWTQALGHHTLSGRLNEITSSHPLMKFVLPFVRTPTNLVKDLIAHTPITAPFTQEWKAAMRVGGESAAIAKGQLATGSLFWAGAGMLAYNGMITGSAPQDAKTRKALEATGWKPYSLKIGDTYYEYRRWDPIGMFLGLSADMMTLAQHYTDPQIMLNEEENAWYSKLGYGIFAALSNNLLNKTYMQGLSETLDVLNSPELSLQRYTGNAVASLVPFASGLRFIRTKTDDNMRELRTIMDYVLNTIPGQSSELPTRFHYVTGQPITYSQRGHARNDMVLDELAKMAPNVLGAPTRVFKGVELSTAQLSRYTELHGTVRINGKTLQERLEILFKSPSYDYDRRRLPDSLEGEEGPRSIAINKIIRQYRQAAGDQLLREDPTLAGMVGTLRQNQRLARSGRRNVNTAWQNLANF